MLSEVLSRPQLVTSTHPDDAPFLGDAGAPEELSVLGPTGCEEEGGHQRGSLGGRRDNHLNTFAN